MSTSIASLPPQAEVPRPITDKLSNVIRRQQCRAAVFRWSGWCALVVFAFLCMVGCDLYYEFDSLASRLGGWLISIVAVAVFGGAWQRLSERPMNWLDAAWRIESVNPQLDERLSSTIELIGERNQNPQQANIRYSNQLLLALSQEATRASSELNPETIPMRSNWLIVSSASTVVTLFLCLTIINPSGVGCSLRNWLLPWAEPIFPQLSIELLPDETTILQGETLSIQAPGLAARIDATLERINSRGISAIPFDNAEIRSVTLLDLQEDCSYRLRMGNRVSRAYSVRVLPKPQILDHEVQVQFPDYTAVLPETYKNTTEPVLAVQGSKVTIQLNVDQDARIAEWSWEDGPTQTCRADDFRFEFTCDAVGSRTAKFRVLSSENISSESILVKLDVSADVSPTIQILDPTLPRFYLPRERELPIQFAAQDDFAIQQVELIYEAVGTEQPQRHSLSARFERLPNETPAAYQGQAFVTFEELPDDCRAARVWLRATDNRGEAFGGPQSIESEGLLIEFQPIDSTPLEQRLAAEQEIIQQALSEVRNALEQAEALVGQLSDEPSADDSQKPWAAANEKVVDSRTALERLAEKLEQSNSDLSEEAQLARDIAEEPLIDAQRNLERGRQMDEAKNQEAAKESAREAQSHTQEALKELEQLEQTLAKKAEQLETAAKLEDLARQQEKLVNELAASDETRSEQGERKEDLPGNDGGDATPEPNSRKEDWRQRQQQVADELAALQKREQPEANPAVQEDDALPEQRRLLDQAKQADLLTQKANELADKLEQPVTDERPDQVNAEEDRDKRMQEIKELQEEVENIAQHAGESEEEEQQQRAAGLEEARQHLQQAKQRFEEQQPEKVRQDRQEQHGQEKQQDKNVQQGRQDQENENGQEEQQDTDRQREQDQQDRRGQQGQQEQQGQQDQQDQQGQQEQQDQQDQNAQVQKQASDTKQDQQDPNRPDGHQKQNLVQNEGQNQNQNQKEKQEQGQKQGQKQAQEAQAAKQDQQEPNGQQAQEQTQRPKTPAESLRQAADALRKNCESCRECANCQNPSGSGGKSSSQPLASQLAGAKQDCEDAAQAPTQKQATQPAKQAGQKLSELAQQAAQQAGLRKNCEKCQKPGDGQSQAEGMSDKSPMGTKSVTDEPFERLPLRGEASSGWTRTKRQLKNGVLDGREALIPESFRNVVTDYFEALAKDPKDSE